jgi:hypothetical protein
MGENEIKGLEEEIDSAVDRLFVEKKVGVPERRLEKPPAKEPTFKMEKDVDLESPLESPLERPSEKLFEGPSVQPIFFKSIEKMESQLLSLEWEITKENIGRTKEEILALRETLKEKPDITSVLSLMEKVLNYMVKNEEKIRPPLVKFLLDSKETIKLLLIKEGDGDINIYKQLAFVGIQARYSCLEELRETRQEQVAVSLKEKNGDFIEEKDTQINEVINKINLFFEKIEELFKRIDQYLLKPVQGVHEPPGQLGKGTPIPMNITIVKVGAKLFGVESEKVVKLFKVPSGLYEKYASQQKIRLKDFEVRLIDLKKIFSIQKRDGKEELKILTVKDKEEHKGLMVDQVLERLTVQSDIGGTYGEHFSGSFTWTYQEHPIEIPILALAKL